MKRAHDLLYDSEASLRLVDRAIGELSPAHPDSGFTRKPLRQHLELVEIGGGDEVDALLDDYANTAAIVVRFCQTAGMLDESADDSLQPTAHKLREVSARTAAATTGILDGIARAVTLVDAFEGRQAMTDEGRHAIASLLRDELHSLTDHLEHQEITSQQLSDIESLFGDIRRRIAQVVLVFSPPPAVETSDAIDAEIERDSSNALCNGRSFGKPH